MCPGADLDALRQIAVAGDLAVVVTIGADELANILASPGSDLAPDNVCRSRYSDAAFGLIAYTA